VRLASFDKRLEPAYKALARALSRLEEAQGRIARKNARAAVRAAQRSLDRKIDALYPAERKKPRKAKKRRTPGKRMRDLKKNGWREIPHEGVLTRIAMAGIRVQRNPLEYGFPYIAPGWAIDVAIHARNKLSAAKRSPTERKAILTELSLQNQRSTP
jgi:hypothetical protein